MIKANNKLIIILGQTASGKTDLSIKLAKKFGGQIISADSRQVYKGLNIGSGKVTKKEMADIPHHLLDIVSPKRIFTVAHFQKMALRAIKKIQTNGDIPFLVGGSGFYIQSIVDGTIIPEVAPNWKLRKALEKKSTQQLFLMLKKIDPQRAETIDAKNPRRLIRAIEIIKATKKPVRPLINKSEFNTLQIGITKSPVKLKELIHKRLLKRLKGGMITEVKKLHANGLSYKRLEELGLEYRFVAQYLQGKLSREEMINTLQKEIEHFSKRQMTWFKRDRNIHWVKNYQEAERLVRKFVT